jgi:hypothetical protein
LRPRRFPSLERPEPSRSVHRRDAWRPTRSAPAGDSRLPFGRVNFHASMTANRCERRKCLANWRRRSLDTVHPPLVGGRVPTLVDSTAILRILIRLTRQGSREGAFGTNSTAALITTAGLKYKTPETLGAVQPATGRCELRGLRLDVWTLAHPSYSSC